MILLGIGSNLPSAFGDRFTNINLAISNLEKRSIKIKKKSSFYESLSYPDNKKPKYINVVVQIETSLSVENLASVLLNIEELLERKRSKKNDPRTCDIDIIDFNGQVKNFKYNNLNFIIPHEKLIYRNFVLFPLKEITPNWIHPETRVNVNSLINNLTNDDKNSILKIEKS